MPVEKIVNVYISSDQHEARFRKLTKALSRTNTAFALLTLDVIGLGLLIYLQQKEIETLREEKEDERAE